MKRLLSGIARLMSRIIPATKSDIRRIEIELHIMANTIDDCIQAATDESTVEDSVLALVVEIKAQLDAAAGNPVKIDALFTQLQANKAKLAAALLTNTAPPTAGSSQ